MPSRAFTRSPIITEAATAAYACRAIISRFCFAAVAARVRFLAAGAFDDGRPLYRRREARHHFYSPRAARQSTKWRRRCLRVDDLQHNARADKSGLY